MRCECSIKVLVRKSEGSNPSGVSFLLHIYIHKTTIEPHHTKPLIIIFLLFSTFFPPPSIIPIPRGACAPAHRRNEPEADRNAAPRRARARRAPQETMGERTDGADRPRGGRAHQNARRWAQSSEKKSFRRLIIQRRRPIKLNHLFLSRVRAAHKSARAQAAGPAGRAATAPTTHPLHIASHNDDAAPQSSHSRA